MGRKERCFLCGNEMQFMYNLEKYGIKGHICGSCYGKKLKEICNIKH